MSEATPRGSSRPVARGTDASPFRAWTATVPPGPPFVKKRLFMSAAIPPTSEPFATGLLGQRPPWQAAPRQVWAQPPQLLGSDEESKQLWPHRICSPGQWQAPSEQVVPEGHGESQLPQLRESVFVSVQPPEHIMAPGAVQFARSPPSLPGAVESGPASPPPPETGCESLLLLQLAAATTMPRVSA